MILIYNKLTLKALTMMVYSMEDFKALANIQSSLRVLQKLMDDQENPCRNELADVWNTLLDARSSIIRKILDDDHTNFAGFDDDLYTILSKRTKMI